MHCADLGESFQTHIQTGRADERLKPPHRHAPEPRNEEKERALLRVPRFVSGSPALSDPAFPASDLNSLHFTVAITHRASLFDVFLASFLRAHRLPDNIKKCMESASSKRTVEQVAQEIAFTAKRNGPEVE